MCHNLYYNSTLETRNVPQVKLRKRDVGYSRRDAADVHGGNKLQVLLGTFVNDAPSRTAVHLHREVLLDRQKLRHVWFTIGHHFVTIHRRCWVIAHVVRDPNSAIEQLDGYVTVILTVVEENPVFLRGREHDGHVCFRSRA